MTQDEIALAQRLDNWKPMSEVPKDFPQFSYPTLKTLFWKRNERAGLETCSQLVGKKLYINVPLFGLWLAGQLSSQKLG